MKLNEIKTLSEAQFKPSAKNYQFVMDWLEENISVGENDWSVKDVHPVVVNASNDIGLRDSCKKIEVQFGRIEGDFYAGLGLESFVNVPKKVTGTCDFSNNQNLTRIDAPLPDCTQIDLNNTRISSITELMDNLVAPVDVLEINDTSIISLEGIAEHAKVLIKRLHFSGDQWKSGGLGLVQMKGLVVFESGTFIPDVSPKPDWEKAQEIIQKYLGKPDQLFDCQSELIEAGLDEYAKL